MVQAEEILTAPNNVAHVFYYAYDEQGRMVLKNVAGSNIVTCSLLWDGYNIVRETDNAAPTYNIWGLDLDGKLQGCGGVGGLLKVSANNEYWQLYYDACGNVSEYCSNSGNIDAHYLYSPFGNPSNTISTGTFTYQFSTKPFVPLVGIVAFQQRMYNSINGCWMSRDPYLHSDSKNLYSFLKNKVLFRVDYLGLEDKEDDPIPLNYKRSAKSIQCIVGVKADGLIGPKTTAKIREFQNLLKLAGCMPNGNADGVWGPLTEKAYRECRKKTELKVKLRISFYCSCSDCCNTPSQGICTDGTPFYVGVAAAPRSIPFNSTILYEDGTNTTATVHDRGDAIVVTAKACKIDIGMDNHDACKKKGVLESEGTIQLIWPSCGD